VFEISALTREGLELLVRRVHTFVAGQQRPDAEPDARFVRPEGDEQ
jgi:hypothetical protein